MGDHWTQVAETTPKITRTPAIKPQISDPLPTHTHTGISLGPGGRPQLYRDLEEPELSLGKSQPTTPGTPGPGADTGVTFRRQSVTPPRRLLPSLTSHWPPLHFWVTGCVWAPGRLCRAGPGSGGRMKVRRAKTEGGPLLGTGSRGAHASPGLPPRVPWSHGQGARLGLGSRPPTACLPGPFTGPLLGQPRLTPGDSGDGGLEGRGANAGRGGAEEEAEQEEEGEGTVTRHIPGPA